MERVCSLARFCDARVRWADFDARQVIPYFPCLRGAGGLFAETLLLGFSSFFTIDYYHFN